MSCRLQKTLQHDLTPWITLITENEIRTAARKLKNNKSSFSDEIKNEMIKSSLNELMPVYLKLRLSELCPKRGVMAILHQFLNVVLRAIHQTTVESVFPVVLENYFVQFSITQTETS